MQEWLLAVFLVVLVSQVAGQVARRIRQPYVVGELIGGIILGPACFGQVFPTMYERVFSPDVRHAVEWFAEIGVIIFCMGVGCELRNLALRHNDVKRVWQLVFPVLALGGTVGVALGLATPQSWIPDGANRGAFVLFSFCGLTVTAVPVLALILRDLGLSVRRIGVTAMAVAGVGDIICWITLAAALDLQRGSGWLQTSLQITVTSACALLCLLATKALAELLTRRIDMSARACITFLTVGSLGIAYLASLGGIHPAIAAVVFGLAMPSALSSRKEALEPLLRANSHLLMPFFVVGIGLSFQPLTSSPWWYGIALGITVVAIGIKVAGALLGGRLYGLDPWTSVGLGMLLSTRGLTEVLVLKIGHTAGVIGDQMFSVGLVVTLATTLAAAPGYRWATRLRRDHHRPSADSGPATDSLRRDDPVLRGGEGRRPPQGRLLEGTSRRSTDRGQ